MEIDLDLGTIEVLEEMIKVAAPCGPTDSEHWNRKLMIADEFILKAKNELMPELVKCCSCKELLDPYSETVLECSGCGHPLCEPCDFGYATDLQRPVCRHCRDINETYDSLRDER